MTSIHLFTANASLATRSPVLREFLPTPDRLAPEQRVDVPEIEESYRVSFSEAALAAAAGQVRDAAQRPTFTDEQGADPDRRVQAYRIMAGL